MARIRSVHPSLFTDEAWVSCSPLARILYIGLMCDADDQGLFEWKPLQIKMRLLPGDAAEVQTLLAELVTVNLIAELQSGGKRLGAIRYFRKFQRPKKPNATFVLPPDWVDYVGLKARGSEASEDEDEQVPHQFPTGSELTQQREDGGWRMEEDSSRSGDALARPRAVVIDADGSVAPMVIAAAPADEANAVWSIRLANAHAAAAGAIDLTRAALHTFVPLRLLCEPTSGEPCAWDEVLEAVTACAAKARATNDPLTSWKPVKWAALALRDARLDSHLPPPRTNHEPSVSPSDKRSRREANLDRALAGFDRIAGSREQS